MFNSWWSAEWSEWLTSTETKKKTKKGPLTLQKIKCPFLDYVQLLMISWVIWMMNVNWNKKKKKKQKKGPPNSLKNKMLIFGLCSTSNDLPSNLSDEHQPKCRKMKKGPLCHQKIKCSFLDYVQLLMIGQVISAMNIDQKATKWKKAPNVIEK